MTCRRRLAAVFVALLVLGPAPGARSQPVTPAPPPPDDAAVEEVVPPAPSPPPAATAEAPAAFDIDSATRAYLDRLSEEEKARSDAYFEGGYWLILWGFLYTLAVCWLLLSRRISARMRDLAERVTRFRFLQTMVYVVQYLLVTAVLFFPLTVYQGFFREHQYGLATQTFGGWMRDQLVGLAVQLVLLSLGLAVLYAAIRRTGRRWWIWGTGIAVAFLIIVVLVAPVYIDPLFNRYEPLEDPRIRQPILEMARANGVPAEEVWQFDASRQSTRISANVSGFLGTMRIRLNDNLLNRCSPPEIEAVMGHELGHYVLNHIYEGIVELGVVLFVGFAFVARGFDWAHERWGRRWEVRGVADPAGWPLLVALLAVFFFVFTPVTNTLIRTNEVEADLFGINAARQPDGFAEVAMKLGEYRKLDPGPLEELLLFDHPSGRARVEMAMRWKKEHLEDLEGGGGGGR